MDFNLGHNFEIIKDKTLIFHICIFCDKTSLSPDLNYVSNFLEVSLTLLPLFLQLKF